MRQRLVIVSIVVLACPALFGCHVYRGSGAEDAQAIQKQLSLQVYTPDPPPESIDSTGSPTHLPDLTPTRSPSATPFPSSTPLPPLIVVDPGHGGRDLGAVHLDAEGRLDFCESEVNLALALRIRDDLLTRGFRVLLTRDGDYLLNEDRVDVNGNGWVDYVDEAQARVDLINASGAELLLSIHQNAFYWEDGESAPDVGGVVTLYNDERPFSGDSLRFARLVQESLVAAFRSLGHDVHDREIELDSELETPDLPGSRIILLGPKSERIVRPCQVPGVLSETLFLTHSREAELARDPQALDRLAVAYADAVETYFTGGRSDSEMD
ncbi:MAG: hypothetical protein A2Y73_06825 [Chloroflexi bacterium RBG_13_56_8]|nr:MAG: hypothetical protein A2Y73_06825 [Chloroflexi bacterium RBG_13_56_8]